MKSKKVRKVQLLNRIGNNIVAFNHISSREVQIAIIETHLGRIRSEFEDRYRAARHRLVFDQGVSEWTVAVYESRFKEFGARGITNALEDMIMIPLAKSVLLAEHQSQRETVFRCFPDADRNKLEIRQE